MRTRFCLRALGAIAMTLSSGCLETNIPPPGSYSEVMVVTEEGARDPLAAALAPHLAKNLDFYVSEEVQFKLHFVRAADLSDVPYKNVVICGPTSSLTHVGRRISALLGPAATEKAASGAANIFKKDDLPGTGQVTVIVTGPSSEAIEDVLRERGDEINDVLERSCRERMRGYLLGEDETALTRDLRRRYGFTIEVPVLYRLLSDEPDPPGIELLRDGPSRLLGVFWLDWDTAPTIKQGEALYNIRKDYVWKRYDGDEMDSTRVRFSYDWLGDYPAVTMEGYWSNSRSLAGGYYKTHFIYDERERLMWVVDQLVFAPGLPKHPLFRELRAIAETFRYD